MINDYPFWLPYLHFGYLPTRKPKLPFNSPASLDILPKDFSNAALRAGTLLNQVIQKSFSTGKTHYIPLSGGLDSRALLAAAIESGTEVETLTFGTPGTMDYEYGKKVSRAAGCRHQLLNLLEYLPDTTDLVEAVRSGGVWTYIFDAYFNRLLTRKMGHDPVVLHGFLGDPVAGSHYRSNIEMKDQAYTAFIHSQQYCRKVKLLPKGIEAINWISPIEILPAIPGATIYERLDFCIRQISAIKPIVIDPKADVRTPFSHPDWLAFMFSAPSHWRQGCKLYEAALLKRWPELFKLPTKNHFGLGLSAPSYQRQLHLLPHRVIGRISRLLGRRSWAQRVSYNYIDFSLAFREPGHMRELARENLSDLAGRQVVPWLDPMKLLSDHVKNKCNYERELQLLIGLEINLKAHACNDY